MGYGTTWVDERWLTSVPHSFDWRFLETSALENLGLVRELILECASLGVDTAASRPSASMTRPMNWRNVYWKSPGARTRLRPGTPCRLCVRSTTNSQSRFFNCFNLASPDNLSGSRPDPLSPTLPRKGW